MHLYGIAVGRTNGFVAGISFSTTEKSLAEAFSKFGHIVECMESACYSNLKLVPFLITFQYLLISWQFTFPAKIIRDKASNRSKGFGYVTFATEDEARKALMEMNGKVNCFTYSYILRIMNYKYQE